MPPITPFLWFDSQAEEAARFYVSVFPNSVVDEVVRTPVQGSAGEGAVLTVRFTLDGTTFVALNGGPAHAGFTETISFVVGCATAAEVDHYWGALSEGGEESRCGWLKDRFGMSWQIVPDGLPALLRDPDPERAKRALDAMMTMAKLDLDAMRRAADGDSDSDGDGDGGSAG